MKLYKMRPSVVCSLLLCFALSANCNTLTSPDVIFHLFTQQNPTISTPVSATPASIMLSSFDLNRETIFTIHKDKESVNSNFNAFVVPSLLNRNVNVVAVDWSAASNHYTLALSNAPVCGQLIATFLNVLVNSFNYDLRLVHIVGVGIGGHISGIAARNANARVGRITALDPSFDGWTHHTEKLRSSDATFVEVLHTTSGLKGYDRPCGDIDYYPNGGSAQPGCLNNVDCSVEMSYVFFSESLTSEISGGPKFEGISCDSHEQALANQCEGSYTATFGGTEPNNSPPGVYYFSTNTAQPFAQTPRTQEMQDGA